MSNAGLTQAIELLIQRMDTEFKRMRRDIDTIRGHIQDIYSRLRR